MAMNRNAIRCMTYRLLGGKIANSLFYFRQYHRFPRWNNPTLFNEKIQYLKCTAFKNDPIYTLCADKYAVREYLSSKGFDRFLIPLISHYNHPDEIKWGELPNRFVLKMNFGNGMNIIVNDKTQLDITSTMSELKKWMDVKSELVSGEMQYAKIPKKIIVEENIATSDIAPVDYKFHCASGKCIMGFTVSGRQASECRLYGFGRDLEPIPYEPSHGHFMSVSYPPVEFNKEDVIKMMNLAETISAPFPYVRVDLFHVNGNIYFSELTFSEGGGFDRKTEYADRLLGQSIDLSLYRSI